jgi:hypothetical protein
MRGTDSAKGTPAVNRGAEHSSRRRLGQRDREDRRSQATCEWCERRGESQADRREKRKVSRGKENVGWAHLGLGDCQRALLYRLLEAHLSEQNAWR